MTEGGGITDGTEGGGITGGDVGGGITDGNVGGGITGGGKTTEGRGSIFIGAISAPV